MKLKFNYNVLDKNTGKEYVAGETYEFEKERAEEILVVINRDTGLPFAKEVIEDAKKATKNKKAKKEEITEKEVQAVANTIVDEATENNKTVEEVVNEIVEESNEDIEKDTE